MFKEITLAIILGSLLGVGLTGGFVTLKNQGKVPHFSNLTLGISPSPPPSQVSQTPPPQLTSIPTTSPPPSAILATAETSSLIISNYKSGQIVNVSKVTLKGNAPSNSQIVLVAPQTTNFTQASAEGLFEIDLVLETGYNPLEITAIDTTDNQHQISFNLTYSTAKL